MTTNGALARSYLAKARVRLRALAVFVAEEAHSDVIREAQELVELAERIERQRDTEVAALRALAGRKPELDKLCRLGIIEERQEFDFFRLLGVHQAEGAYPGAVESVRRGAVPGDRRDRHSVFRDWTSARVRSRSRRAAERLRGERLTPLQRHRSTVKDTRVPHHLPPRYLHAFPGTRRR